MVSRYVRAVLERTFTGFVPLVDAMQILMASAVPLYFWWRGHEMPADTVTNVLAWIGIAALGYVALRLLTAPYFIWLDQEKKISELNIEIQAPNHATKISASQKLHERQHKFWDEASALASLVRQRTVAPFDWRNPIDEQISSTRQRILPILQSLSLDQTSFRLGHDIIHLCGVVSDSKQNGDFEPEYDEQLQAALMQFGSLISGTTPPSAEPSERTPAVELTR